MIRIVRWEAATHHNKPILSEITRDHNLFVKAILNPISHQNRINLWSMTAGMLDIARFMNKAFGTATYGTTETGSSQERALYNELSPYIAVNYRKEMQSFRLEFNNVTRNFVEDYAIKEALYEVIMNLPKDRIGSVSPFWLLRKAITKMLAEQELNQPPSKSKSISFKS